MPHLPHLLYEALPLIYVIAGLASIFGLDMTSGKAGGCLLLLAAITIFRLRRAFRRGF